MYDIPKTASTKCMYADDIALMESGLTYAEIQQTLTIMTDRPGHVPSAMAPTT